MTNCVYGAAQNRREYAIELLSPWRAEFFALPWRVTPKRRYVVLPRLPLSFAISGECLIVQARNDFSESWSFRRSGARCAVTGLCRTDANSGAVHSIDPRKERPDRIGSNRHGENGGFCSPDPDSARFAKRSALSGIRADTGTSTTSRECLPVLRPFLGGRNRGFLRRSRLRPPEEAAGIWG